MFDPCIKISGETENSYMLSSIIGKRAIQIIGGSEKLTETSSKNAITIAINEFKDNKLAYMQDKRYFNAIK